MNKMMPKLASTTLAAWAVLGLGAVPVMAASSGGAQTYRVNDCFGDDYYRICAATHGEYNTVTTPSGNSTWQNNAKYDYTVYLDGEVWYTQHGSFRNVAIFKKGEAQVYSYSAKDTANIGDETCTLEYRYHYANGQVQISDYDYECVPS